MVPSPRFHCLYSWKYYFTHSQIMATGEDKSIMFNWLVEGITQHKIHMVHFINWNLPHNLYVTMSIRIISCQRLSTLNCNYTQNKLVTYLNRITQTAHVPLSHLKQKKLLICFPSFSNVAVFYDFVLQTKTKCARTSTIKHEYVV